MNVPSDLQVSLHDIDHGYSVTADAQVSWGGKPESNGGPLHLAFHDGALVMLTPSGSGSYENLRFYLRGVGYQVRAELYQREDGSWDIGRPGTRDGTLAGASRFDRRSYGDTASDAARRDITAILRAVGLQVLAQRPDLALSGAVARKRAEVERARHELQETIAKLHEQEAAYVAAQDALAKAEHAKLAHYAQEVNA